ncbi:unnamed protein product [Microthlaspi erraticum]|uniref:Uncharacterized protein n=1 Tax=Microthlaspi erraticum TaxID=1685480 RepID=A0A6D2KLJ2_9BRAS|nr:unnamed protein product [Microthlaspi erraticum]
MRIEGEKGVKTQSAPKHWPRTRKSDFGRAIPIWPTTVEPGRNAVLGRIDHCATETVRATHEPGKKAAIGRNFRIGTDRPCRSIRETYDRPRPKFSPKQFGRPNRSTATKSIGHRPKLF